MSAQPQNTDRQVQEETETSETINSQNTTRNKRKKTIDTLQTYFEAENLTKSGQNSLLPLNQHVETKNNNSNMTHTYQDNETATQTKLGNRQYTNNNNDKQSIEDNETSNTTTETGNNPTTEDHIETTSNATDRKEKFGSPCMITPDIEINYEPKDQINKIAVKKHPIAKHYDRT